MHRFILLFLLNLHWYFSDCNEEMMEFMDVDYNNRECAQCADDDNFILFPMDNKGIYKYVIGGDIADSDSFGGLRLNESINVQQCISMINNGGCYTCPLREIEAPHINGYNEEIFAPKLGINGLTQNISSSDSFPSSTGNTLSLLSTFTLLLETDNIFPCSSSCFSAIPNPIHPPKPDQTGWTITMDTVLSRIGNSSSSSTHSVSQQFAPSSTINEATYGRTHGKSKAFTITGNTASSTNNTLDLVLLSSSNTRFQCISTRNTSHNPSMTICSTSIPQTISVKSCTAFTASAITDISYKGHINNCTSNTASTTNNKAFRMTQTYQPGSPITDSLSATQSLQVFYYLTFEKMLNVEMISLFLISLSV